MESHCIYRCAELARIMLRVASKLRSNYFGISHTFLIIRDCSRIMRKDHLISTSSVTIKNNYFLWTLDPSFSLSCGTHFTRSLIIFALKGVPWQWKIRRREQWNDDLIFVRPVWMCFVHWHVSIFNLQKSNDVFRKRIHAERCTPDVWSWLRISSSFNSVIIFSSNLMMWWFKKVYRSWNFRKLFHTIFDTI